MTAWATDSHRGNESSRQASDEKNMPKPSPAPKVGIDLKQLQKDVWENKVKQGFNVTDVPLEFSYTYGELAEAFEAYRKKLPEVGEELADVMIYLLGLATILDVDMEEELVKKIAKNAKREYKTIDGIVTRTKESE